MLTATRIYVNEEAVLSPCAMWRILHGLFVACVEDNDAATEIAGKNNPTKSMLSHEKPFLFDPVQGRCLGSNRIHGFHPWLLKLDPAGVLYLSHPEGLIGHPVFLLSAAKDLH